MFSCFKNNDRATPTHEPKPEETSPLSMGRIQAVIAIPGHQAREWGDDWGCDTYNDIDEHPSNREMIEKHLINKAQVPVHMLLRKESSKSYSSYCRRIKKEIKSLIKENGYDPTKVLVIEYHYNAASVPTATGCCMYVSDHRSAILANGFVDQWSKDYNIPKRHSYKFKKDGKREKIKGVEMRSSGRGSGWLNAVSSIGCYTWLWEGMFVDYKIPESMMFFENHAKGIKMIGEFNVRQFNKMAQ